MSALVLIIASVSANFATASGPSSNRLLNYQIRLTDPSGYAVADGTKNIKLTFYDATVGGSVLHTDCGTGTPATRKVVFYKGTGSVLIGDEAADSAHNCTDNSAPNALPSDLFTHPALFLGVTIEGDLEMTPRKRIVAAGYAMNADRLDDLETSAAGGTGAFVPVTNSSGLFALTGTPSSTAAVITANPASPASDALLLALKNTGVSKFTVDASGNAVAAGSLTVGSFATDPSGVNGMMYYNTASNTFRCYQNGWQACASAGSLSGSGTAGQVAYWDGTSSMTGNANFVWDSVHGRLGIGASSPTDLLSVGTGSAFRVNAAGDVATAGALSVGGTATLAGSTILSSLGAGVVHASATGLLTSSTVALGSEVSGTLAVTNGGTGAGSFTQYGVLVGNGTGSFGTIGPANAGYLLLAQGVSANPSFTAMSGDATMNASGVVTLATVNSSVGSFGSASSVPVITVDGKGRVTGVTGTGIAIDAAAVISGQLTAARGGLGLDTSGSTGVPMVNGGAWSIGSVLPTTLGGTGTSTAFTAGSMVFATVAGAYAQDNANLFYDQANKRLGIGTNAPGSTLTVGSETSGGNVDIEGTLGAELMPAMVSGNWTLGANWSISNGQLIKLAGAPTNANPTASQGIVAGHTYKVVMVVDSGSGTYNGLYVGGTVAVQQVDTGTYTVYVTARTSENLKFVDGSYGEYCTISSLSLKEVLPTSGNLDVKGALAVRGLTTFKNPVGFNGSAPGYSPIEITDNGTDGIRIYRALRPTQYLALNEAGGSGHVIQGFGEKPIYFVNNATGYGIQFQVNTTTVAMNILQTGNVSVGSMAGASMFNVGTANQLQVTSAGDLSTSGSVTFSGLSTAGVVHNSAAGLLTTSLVSLTNDVTGVLPASLGGTGSATKNFVDLTTVQTAAGAKTWSDAAVFNGGITDSGTLSLLSSSATLASSNSRMEISQDGVGVNVNALTLTNPHAEEGTAVSLKFSPSNAPNIRYAAISGIEAAGGGNVIDLAFTTGTGAVISEKMRILAGGNVGIGTASPLYKLDVNGQVRIGAGTPSAGYGLSVVDPTYGNITWGNNTVAGQLSYSGNNAVVGAGSNSGLLLTTIGATRMAILANGSVGVGTTSPSALFAVGATSQFQVNSSGALSVGGAATLAGSTVLSSLGAGVVHASATGLLTSSTVALGSEVSGVLGIANGGTGSATQNFVDLTTGQTVAGAKVWSNAATFNGGITDNGALSVSGSATVSGGLVVGGTGQFGSQSSQVAQSILHVDETSTITTDGANGTFSALELNPSANSSATYYGTNSQLKTAAANARNFTQILAGSSGAVLHIGSGTVAEAKGVLGSAANLAGGTITKAIGGDFTAGAFGAGGVTSGYGVRAGAILNGAGNIGTMYGVYVQNPAKYSTGTVTGTNYGLYLENQTAGASNYNLYSVGGANALTGSLAVGSAAQFQVTSAGNLSTSGSVTFSGLNAAGVVHNSAAGLLSTSLVSLANDVSGTLPATLGGTGLATYATGDMIYASASDTLSRLGAGTNGYVLTMNGGFPTWTAASIAAEADTLASVTGRSASTSIASTFNGGLTASTLTVTGASTLAGGTITGTFLPDVDDTYNIGSSTRRLHQLFVNDLHIGANSLYMNEKKVLGSDAATMSFTADTNQNLQIQTFGSGNLQLTTAGNGAVQLTTSGTGSINLGTAGTNTNISLNAAGTGSQAQIAATSAITLTAPAITVTGAMNMASLGASQFLMTDASKNVVGTTVLPLANGGTGATTASASRAALGAAASGANSDITSLSGLTTALSVGQGGTGAATFTSGGVLYGSGTSAIGVSAAGTSGQLLVASAGGVPTFVTMSGDATIGATGGIALKSTGTAGTYGSATQVPVFTTDAQGRVTGVTNTSIAIAASAITSGQLSAARGGTGLDTSGSTGVAMVNGGAWSIGSVLPATLGGTGLATAPTLAGQYLRSSGAGTWAVASIAAGDVPLLNQSTTGNASTATALQTARSIYGNSFNGSADLAQVIASTYGGTGSGFTKFTGPASAERTFTLPNADATILTTNATVTVAQGGTGATTLTGLLKGNGTSAFTAASAGTDYLAPTGSGAGLTSLTAANISAGTAGISITGNAATVTTNANLTGDVTSSGNATTYNNIVPLAKGGTNNSSYTTGQFLAYNSGTGKIESSGYGSGSFLTSEADTLASVTGRNATTTVASTFNGGLTASALNVTGAATVSGNMNLNNGSSLRLTGGSAPSQGDIMFGTAANAGFDTNLMYLADNSMTGGFVFGSSPAFTSSNGPFFGGRGNTYSAYAGQRGIFFISSGDVSSPTGIEGSILLQTLSTTRLAVMPGGNVGVGTTSPSSLFSVGATSQFQVNGSGVVAAGTWNGSTIGTSYGGTGITAAPANAGQYLRSSGAGTWAVASIAAGDVPTLNQNTTGSAASFTGSLSGDVTGTQGSTAISAATVTGKLITGYSSAAGTVAATDTLLQAINKLNGNDALNLKLTGGTMAGSLAMGGQNISGGGTFTATSFVGALTGNASTATTLATARSIYGNSFNGSADLTQVIASTYGGTGNGFTKFTGPASAERIFTLPNADATILTTNAAVTVAQGGTGATTLTQFGLLVGNGTSAVSAISPATAGYLLLAQGGSANPSFNAMSGDATIGSTGAVALKSTGTAGTYGSATQVPVFTTDAQGRVTGVTPTTISGLAPTGSASGDLSGTYPSPTVAKINGVALGTTTATAGSLLIGSGSAWVSNAMSGDVTIGSTGVTAISAATVTGKTLTGYSSTTGAITTSDTILSAIGKLNGNQASYLPLAGGTMAGAVVMGGNNISGGGTFTATTFSGALSGNATTATTLATGRSIYGNSFNGSADLAQVIASTYGGTGSGFTKFTGPASAERTFTLPNADATILTTNAAVTVAQGGTGATALTAGGILLGNGASAVSASAAPTLAGQYLRSSGAGTWAVASIAAGDIPTLNQSTSGNAATATALQTARNINGVSFNGTGDITVAAAAGTLTGTALASGVTASSLTSVGTLANLTVTNAISGSVTGSAASFTGSLSGDVTGTQGSTAISAATVTGKLITGYSSAAGTVAATDTLLQAINKLNGNDALNLKLTGGTMAGSLAMGGSNISGGGTFTATSFVGALSGNASTVTNGVYTTGAGTVFLAPTGSGAGLTSLTAANISAGTAGISITGNAATVTTNANLTGDVTSVGNATTYSGIVPIAKGGTNASSFGASSQFLWYNGTSVVASGYGSSSFLTSTPNLQAVTGAGAATTVASAFNGGLTASTLGVTGNATLSGTTYHVGNVGIGTASSSYKLDVSGQTRLGTGTPTAGYGLSVVDPTYGNITWGNGTVIGQLSYSGSNAVIGTGSAHGLAFVTSGTAKMTVQNDGSVGIGTAAPAQALSVVGSSGISLLYSTVPSVSPTYPNSDLAQFVSTPPVDVSYKRTLDIVQGSGNTGSVIQLWTAAASNAASVRMTIDPNGSVGIGTRSPAALLSVASVAGHATGAFTVDSSGNVNTYGTLSASGSVTFSGLNTAGIVHNSAAGLLTTSSIVNGDLTAGSFSSITGVGTLGNLTVTNPISGSVTGSAASFTGSLSGDVTGTQGSTAIAATTVTGKALTGYSSTTGAISASDTILSAINKLNGNDALNLKLTGGTMAGSVAMGGFNISGGGTFTATTFSGALSGNASTATTLATARSIYGNSFNGSADLTQVIANTYGGTGYATYATGDMLYASGTNTLSKLAATTNGYVLTLAGGVPTWAAATTAAAPNLQAVTAVGATTTIASSFNGGLSASTLNVSGNATLGGATSYVAGNLGVGTGSPAGVFQVFDKGVTGATIIPDMTSDTTPSGVASCSSYNPSFPCYEAFSAPNWYQWMSNSTTTGTLGYQFPTGKIITSYAIMPAYMGPIADMNPNTWTFEGSNNGSSWTVLDTQTNHTGWTYNVLATFPISNTTSYTYYRLNITANGGNGYTSVAVSKLYMYDGNGAGAGSALLVDRETGKVGVGTTDTTGAQMTIQARDYQTTALVVKATTRYGADLQDWQDSNGVVVAQMAGSGYFGLGVSSPTALLSVGTIAGHEYGAFTVDNLGNVASYGSLYAGTTSQFQVSNTGDIYSTGHLGIGAGATPTATISMRTDLTVNPGSSDMTGWDGTVYDDGTTANSTYGANLSVAKRGAVTSGTQFTYGIKTIVLDNANNAGATTNTFGGLFNATGTIAGTSTSEGVYASAQGADSNYGLNAMASGGANNYAVYAYANGGSANNYGIYSADGLNYFNGNVGVGAQPQVDSSIYILHSVPIGSDTYGLRVVTSDAATYGHDIAVSGTSVNGMGVFGSGDGGVRGEGVTYGVTGVGTAASGSYGVRGFAYGTNSVGVVGSSDATGVSGSTTNGYGVYASASGSGYGIYSSSGTNYFNGNVGIGATPITYQTLTMSQSLNAGTNNMTGLSSTVYDSGTGTNTLYGANLTVTKNGSVTSATQYTYGLKASATDNGSSSSSSASTTGGYFTATGSGTLYSTSTGLYASATGGYANTGITAVASATGSTSAPIGINVTSSNTLSATGINVTATGGGSGTGIVSLANGAGTNIGLSGSATTGTSNYGVQGTATVTGSASGVGGKFTVSGTTSSTNYGIYASATGGATNYGVYSVSGTNYFGGSVGIGLSSPLAKLDVGGPGFVTSFTGTTHLGMLVRGSYNGDDYSGIDFSNWGGYVTQNPMARIASRGTNSKAYLDFGTSNNSANGITNLAMTIDPDGNVGIGATAPLNALEVHKASSTTYNGAPQFRVSSVSTGNRAEMVLSDNLTANALISFLPTGVATTQRLSISASYPNVESDFVLLGNGNVGIGTVSPTTFKLQVAGSVGPNATNSYNLGASGSNWGCLYYNNSTLGTCASDVRLKQDISDLNFGDALASVDGLRLRSFSYKSDAGHSIYDGLIAQETEAVAPALVTTGEDGYKYVKYGDVQWLTLQALQQLSHVSLKADKTTGAFTVTPATTATALTPAADSRALALAASVWDGTSGTAVAKAFTLTNKAGTDKTTRLSLANSLGEEVAYFGDNGDAAVKGSLRFGTDGTGATLYNDSTETYTGNRLMTSAMGFGARGTGFAEQLPSVDTLEEGELVMVDTDNAGGVRRAVQDDTHPSFLLTGVVSKQPAYLAGTEDVGKFPITVTGRAKVKVSTENGAIGIGDPITIATLAGAGRRTDDPAYIIGVALESYSGSEPGLITVFVRPGWFNGTTIAAASDSTSGTTLLANVTAPVDFKAQPLIGIGAMEGLDGLWSIDGNGKLTAKEVVVDKLTTKDVTVEVNDQQQATGEATIGVGTSEVVIDNAMVKPNSRIFITFYGNVEGNWWIGSRTDGRFTVNVSKLAPADLKLEYLIMNVQDNRTIISAPASTMTPEPTPAATDTTPDATPAASTDPAPAAGDAAPTDPAPVTDAPATAAGN